MSATAQASAFWAERHTTYGPSWFDRYWNDTAAPHRAAVIETIQSVHRRRPITSVIELGCHVGTNLRLLGEALPHLALSGVDINAEAIRHGEERFAALEGAAAPPSLVHGSLIEHLGTLRSGSIDVIFSCYALSYVAPADLPRTVRAMLRVARRALVIAEPMWLDDPEMPYELLKGIPEYRHNWIGVLRRFGVPRQRLSIVEIPRADHLNAVLTLEVS